MPTPAARMLDLIAVLAFVTIGRASHGEAESLGGVLTTLWPFLGGLVVGWLLAAGLHRPVGSRTGGLFVWGGVLAGAVALRAASGQGLAVSFVLVIAGFFAVVLLGWRLLAARRQA